MRFLVETYGCTMNQGEGVELQRKLAALGHAVVSDEKEAEIVVVNTCTVIRATELKILKRMAQLRSEGKELIVTGCMAAVQAKDVERRFPGTLLVPPERYDGFQEAVTELYGVGQGTGDLPPSNGRTAIVPIAQGCLGSCAYCITKLARGALTSYPVLEILERVRSEVKAGAREILMTAQDTGCYGLDTGTDLPSLLRQVCVVEGDFMVRVGMMNPDSLKEIIEPLAICYADPKIYKFLHLPVQSGSDRLLRTMSRSYTVAEFVDLVGRFRARQPRLTLSTDVIVGHPGETDADHELTKNLLRSVRPNIVNVTRFSARPGTPAASMKGQVVSRIAKDRSRELAKLRFEIALSINQSLVGLQELVIASEPGKDGTTICRDAAYVPVVVAGGLQIGQRVKVEITRARPTHVHATVLG